MDKKKSKWSREDYKSSILIKKKKNQKWFKDNVPLFEIASNSRKFKPQRKIIFDTVNKEQADAFLKLMQRCLSTKVSKLQKGKLPKFTDDLIEIQNCKKCSGKPLRIIRQKGGIILPWLVYTVLKGTKKKQKRKKHEDQEEEAAEEEDDNF